MDRQAEIQTYGSAQAVLNTKILVYRNAGRGGYRQY
jgi:hypothetical protein